MAGGLMNLVSQGNQNVILNSNPSKTFWKSTYKKYTNFGKQNFRIDYEGTPILNPTTESTFRSNFLWLLLCWLYQIHATVRQQKKSHG